MEKAKIRRLVTVGLLLAVGIILPFVTSHGFGVQGTVLLPMHIPVLICGLLCGPVWGGVLGFILPIISGFTTGMPVVYPMMPIMACELFTYGSVSGLIYKKTPIGRWKIGSAAALVIAMICGRITYGAVFQILLAISGELKALTVWGAIVTGLPGIIIQILFIPALIYVLEKVSPPA